MVLLEMATAAMDVVNAATVVHQLGNVFQLLSIVLLLSLAVFVHVMDAMGFEE